MKWLKQLYIGEKVTDKAALIALVEQPVWKSRFAFSCLISPAPQQGENLEAIPLIMLNEKYFNRKDRVILGLASSMNEANDLMLRMTQDCLDGGGGVKVKEWFLNLPEDAFTDRGEVVS